MLVKRGEAISLAKTKHGHALASGRTPTYQVWCSMRRRCSEMATGDDYRDYFLRGIRVCDQWQDYQQFLADMGERPAGMSIDRYPNNNGNYEPGNCRWATNLEQARNKRNTVRLEINGISKTTREWGEQYGLSRETIKNRIERGWSVERAVTEPLPLEGKGSYWRYRNG